MPAEVTQDNVGGFARKGKATLPDGTVVETGEHFVRAQGGRNFLSNSWTKYGIDDAMHIRAARAGEKPPLPIHQIFREAQQSAILRAEKERREKIGLTGQAPRDAAPAPQSELGAMLAAFEGDEDMQIEIIKRWNKRHAQAKPPVATEAKQGEVTVTEIDGAKAAEIEQATDKLTRPRGPVGRKGPVDLATATGIPSA